jgi:hypothetical protein
MCPSISNNSTNDVKSSWSVFALSKYPSAIRSRMGKYAVEFSSAAVSLYYISMAMHIRRKWTYRSSTRYGAELKEALSATLMLGPARAPMCMNALSRTRLRTLSTDTRPRIAPEYAQCLFETLGSLTECFKLRDAVVGGRLKLGCRWKMQRIAFRSGILLSNQRFINAENSCRYRVYA